MKGCALTAVLRRYSDGARLKLFLDASPRGLQETESNASALLNDLELLRSQLVRVERLREPVGMLGAVQPWVDLRITLEHIMSLCGHLALPISASVADWYGSMLLSAKSSSNVVRSNTGPPIPSVERQSADSAKQVATLARRWARVTNGTRPKGHFNEWRFLSEAERCLADICRLTVDLLGWMMSREFGKNALQGSGLSIADAPTRA